MKKAVLVLLALLFVNITIVDDAFSQDRGGFIGRLIRRFSGGETEEEAPAPAAPPKEGVETVEEPAEESAPQESMPPKAAGEAGPEMEQGLDLQRVMSEMSDSELIGEIEGILADYGQIVNILPGLSVEEGEDGAASYTYAPAGVLPKNLDNLDGPDLENLYLRVYTEANKLHTEDILRQLDAAKRPVRPAATPSGPPSPPPSPARVPQPPPRPPETPSRPQQPPPPVPAPVQRR